MGGLGLAETEHQFSLSFLFGFEHPFFIVSHLVAHTWAILAIMTIILLLCRWVLTKKDGVTRYLILSFVNFFINLCTASLGSFSFAHFSFITALFTFILFCNTISVIPWLEEPTTDLNTTLALGLISFLYTQWVAIRAHGLGAYIKDYFSPFFIMFPLNVVGKIASVVSISFRLFGNIFGGAIISSIWFKFIEGSFLFELGGVLSGLNIGILLFFSIFEGFLQAFVFAMLSLTYLSISLQGEGH